MKKATTKSAGAKRSSGSKNSSSTQRGVAAKAPAKRAAPKKASSKSSAKGGSSASEDLEKVMKEGLKDIYYAEKQLAKALNKMAKGAENAELKQGFETHREETLTQIEKLEQVFEMLGMRAAGKKCPAMDGLIEEGSEALEEYDKGPARDAALIMSAQKVEHYEIASYGSLRTFAEVLGYSDCAQIFEEILEQESATDEKLTTVAQTVNEDAMAAGEGDDEDEE